MLRSRLPRTWRELRRLQLPLRYPVATVRRLATASEPSRSETDNAAHAHEAAQSEAVVDCKEKDFFQLTFTRKDVAKFPEKYAANCLDRNYPEQAKLPHRIAEMAEGLQRPEFRHLNATNQTISYLQRHIEQVASLQAALTRHGLSDWSAVAHAIDTDWAREAARELKASITDVAKIRSRAEWNIRDMITSLPNGTSKWTPRGREPKHLTYLNDMPQTRQTMSHIDIGRKLDILDFESAAKASGWGWYYFKGDGALLEQALMAYAQSICQQHGFQLVIPPTIVRSQILGACGFMPRDANDEQQTYTINERQRQLEEEPLPPSHALAATAEIPLAALYAERSIRVNSLPILTMAPSRCYRAEAGARGTKSKGLYRVHEFTKLEMFAWMKPEDQMADQIFDLMVQVQMEIIGQLGLRARVLEMPTEDLGASAMRKQDIEVWFPSRQDWGEVTSASQCSDYQTQRLQTRCIDKKNPKTKFPWTANGTAMAVPRMWAAVVEHYWSEEQQRVVLPDVLVPFMGGKKYLDGKPMARVSPWASPAWTDTVTLPLHSQTVQPEEQNSTATAPAPAPTPAPAPAPSPAPAARKPTTTKLQDCIKLEIKITVD